MHNKSQRTDWWRGNIDEEKLVSRCKLNIKKWQGNLKYKFLWIRYVILIRHHLIFQMAHISPDLIERNGKTGKTNCKNYPLSI